MGLFKKIGDFLSNIGKPKAEAAPKVDPGISSAWSPKASKPSLFQRAKEGVSNLFKPKPKASKPKASKAKAPKTSESPLQSNVGKAAESLKESRRIQNIPDKGKRQEEIFKYRRNASDDGKAFYRLTQSIWDDPSIPVSKRDEAIRDYFTRKYGISDMNRIYDFVMRKNEDLIERYRRSPQAARYEVLKNFKMQDAQL